MTSAHGEGVATRHASTERGCYGEIAEIVANTRGLFSAQTKMSGDVDLLNRIWRAMGVMLEDVLLRKKSCIIPDFLHVSIKVQQVTYFDGERVFDKPQLVLLPDFTSKFHLQNVLVMPDAHYHATVPCYISYATIAALAETDRFVVEAAIKDSVREIGKYLQRNREAVLTIDIGVGSLEFRGREYRVKWAPEFLQRLQEHVGADTLVKPYDPPSLTQGGPQAPCRFASGQLTKQTLRQHLERTIDAESRMTVAEMNDGKGGSGYYKTYW